MTEIEKTNGVENSDQAVRLEQSQKLLAGFETEKKAEYSEIVNRVQQIEGIIGLAERELPEANQSLECNFQA